MCRAKLYIVPYTGRGVYDHFLPYLHRQINPVTVRIDQIGTAKIDQLGGDSDLALGHIDQSPILVENRKKIVQLEVQMHPN